LSVTEVCFLSLFGQALDVLVAEDVDLPGVLWVLVGDTEAVLTDHLAIIQFRAVVEAQVDAERAGALETFDLLECIEAEHVKTVTR